MAASVVLRPSHLIRGSTSKATQAGLACQVSRGTFPGRAGLCLPTWSIGKQSWHGRRVWWQARPEGPSSIQLLSAAAGQVSRTCVVARASPTGPAFEALSDIQKGQVAAYIDMLMEWNTKMNITAVRDRDEAMLRHVEDSLALLPSIEAHAGSSTGETPLRLIDVGSGGGLPGLLLAIARPEWEVTLLDTLRKRCDFVSMVLPKIAVTNVRVVWARAETAGQDSEHRESYDIAVARAVAEMRLLNEFCLPMVRVGGHLVAAKGPDPQPEVDAAQRSLQELGGKLLSITPVESFGREGQQFTSVVVQKHKKCPKKFPRSPGTPKKSPL